MIKHRIAGPTKNVLQRLATQGVTLMCSLSTSGPYTRPYTGGSTGRRREGKGQLQLLKKVYVLLILASL